MYRAGVILSGCGNEDGTSIEEAIMTFLALDNLGVETLCLSLDKEQFEVFDHLAGRAMQMGQKRNILVESARLSPGRIKDIEDTAEDDFDLLILPGGKGVLKNLSTFMDEKIEFRVNSSVQNTIRQAYSDGKPIGATSTAIVVLAKALGSVSPNLKVSVAGQSQSVRAAIEKFGVYYSCEEEICIDRDNHVVTAPHLSGKSLNSMKDTIEVLVKKLVELVNR